MADTLFERYGGFAKLSKVVMAFYDNILDDDLTGPYFDNVDMRALIDHQTKFVASVMGGPASFTDAQLQRVHRGHGITREAFARMLDLFDETLRDFQFRPEDIATMHRALAARERLVVEA